MGLFSKRNNNTAPLIPADTPAARKVVETLQSIDLDPNEVMLVGSAALALYGVELALVADPIRDYATPKERPGDLDFLSTVHYIEQLYAHGTQRLPKFTKKSDDSGLSTHNTATIIRAPAVTKDTLPIDIITPFQETRHNPNTLDKKLRERILASRAIAGTAFRAITLEAAVSSMRTAHNDPKVERDLAEIRRIFPGI